MLPESSFRRRHTFAVFLSIAEKRFLTSSPVRRFFFTRRMSPKKFFLYKTSSDQFAFFLRIAKKSGNKSPTEAESRHLVPLPLPERVPRLQVKGQGSKYRVLGPILCAIENEKRRFSIWISRSEKKSYLMRSDFGDFRAAFFDLAFSIATSYINGGDFRSEKWRSNNTARLDTKACARSTNKNQEKTPEIRNTHTPEHKRLDHKKSTQEHSKA